MRLLRPLGKLILLLLLLAAAVVVTLYTVDGHALPEARSYLTGDGYTATELDDGSLVFTPGNPNGRGLLIMHGALIEPLSYANTAAYFAARGYSVFLPHGGRITRLSINAVDRAAEWIAQSGIGNWYAIGHSMGGMATLELISRHPGLPIRAVALWAAAMPADYSALTQPMLFLWGDHDGLLPQARFEQGRERLPPQVVYETIRGANHQDFAMYGHQFFDGEGQLGWRQQISFANRRTATFFAPK